MGETPKIRFNGLNPEKESPKPRFSAGLNPEDGGTSEPSFEKWTFIQRDSGDEFAISILNEAKDFLQLSRISGSKMTINLKISDLKNKIATAGSAWSKKE